MKTLEIVGRAKTLGSFKKIYTSFKVIHTSVQDPLKSIIGINMGSACVILVFCNVASFKAALK